MDTVQFGSYPQSDTSGNIKDPIEWILIDRQNDKVLLLSKYILDCKRFDESKFPGPWAKCTLRNWLNNTFINEAFSNYEINYILNTNVISNDFDEQGNSIINNTNDKIFLLSTEECIKYFYNDSANKKNKKNSY